MQEANGTFGRLSATSKQFARRLLTIGENRLELLAVEVQEGRERLLHVFLVAVGLAAFGLLAGVTFTAAMVVWLWSWSPVAVLLILTAVYGAVAYGLWHRLINHRRDAQMLSTTLDQLKKDRACLEKVLA